MMKTASGWYFNPIICLIFTCLYLIPDGGGAVFHSSRGIVAESRILPTTNPMTNQCPSKCTCQSTRMDCVILPPVLFPNTTSLTINGGNITAIQIAISGAQQLLSLALVSSNLQHLSPNTFRSLPKLQSLDLSSNKLSGKLATRTFEGLTSLQLLNLSANELDSVENESLLGLSKLHRLDLSHNFISQIDNAAVFPFSVQTLNLSTNLLANLSILWFQQLTDLKILLIARNQLRSIDTFVFQNLRQLETLDLSENFISTINPNSFAGLVNLKNLNLRDNKLVQLHHQLLRPLVNLDELDLSANSIDRLNSDNFQSNSNLKTLRLNHLPNLTSIGASAFGGTVQLTHLTLSNNPSLHFIHPDAFKWMSTSLRLLDINTNNLTSMHPQTLQVLANLQELSLFGNKWICNCHLWWLPKWLNTSNVTLLRTNDTKCTWTKEEVKVSLLTNQLAMEDLNCTKTSISSHSDHVYARYRATALLECQVTGDPPPSLIWILPRKHVFHLYPSGWKTEWYLPYQEDHPMTHTKNNSLVDSEMNQRIRVLKNGNLYISEVLGIDAGTYVCLASNTFNNDTARITLALNYQILIHVKVVSILVGFATSIAALLLLLIVQLINMALNRWGCCCCQRLVSPKAKQIRKMLEGIEQYKSQQLDRLKDNYTMQVNRIKENCAQQMDRIRDSYGTQVDRLRDIRDFGTQQLDKVRDQYYEQVKKVRDYSSQQMSKVRENYIFQRNRVRKFSAHQLIRLRENYKLQQQHLNKILETLNIESCRTGCSRSESLDFTADVEAMNRNFTENLPSTFRDQCSLDSDNQSQTPYSTPPTSRTPSCKQFNVTDSPSSQQATCTHTTLGIEPINELEETIPSPSQIPEVKQSPEECKIKIQDQVEGEEDLSSSSLLESGELSENRLATFDDDYGSETVNNYTRETSV